MANKPKTFLICPVRGGKEALTTEIVKTLEKKFIVYWPPRDTNQNNSELNICTNNYKAIQTSDMVHIFWDGESQGCLFDLGIAFTLFKNVIPVCLPKRTIDKSFQNMIIDYHVNREINIQLLMKDVIRKY